jgi:hypothetical protein
MSIYATLWNIQLERVEPDPKHPGDYRECWVEVYAQGVPSHIDYTGPIWEWLPPPVLEAGDDDLDWSYRRAVVFVEAGTEKGTERNGQEYVSPLLILSGAEYEALSFHELIYRLQDALQAPYPLPATCYVRQD